jgi:hypothetical protein
MVSASHCGDRIRFHRVAAPSDEQMRILLDRIIARMLRRLAHDGWLIEDPEQPYLDLEPRDALDELSPPPSATASPMVRARARERSASLRSPSLARTDSPKPLTVDRDGFSLNASVACDAHSSASFLSRSASAVLWRQAAPDCRCDRSRPDPAHPRALTLEAASSSRASTCGSRNTRESFHLRRLTGTRDKRESPCQPPRTCAIVPFPAVSPPTL